MEIMSRQPRLPAHQVKIQRRKNLKVIFFLTGLNYLLTFQYHNFSEAEKETPQKPKEKVVHDDMMFGTDKQKVNSILLQEIVNKKRGSPPQTKAAPRKPGAAADYINIKGRVNYDKLLTDEILLADEQLVAKAKSLYDIAGMYFNI